MHILRCPPLQFLATALAALFVMTAEASAAPDPARYAAIVVDAESGRVLHAHSSTKRRYPASLTKMMTLYLTFEAVEAGKLSLDTNAAGEHARGQPGNPRAWAWTERPATAYRRRHPSALVTKSANDAASVLAEGSQGESEEGFGESHDGTKAQVAGNDAEPDSATLPACPRTVTIPRREIMAILSRALIMRFPYGLPILLAQPLPIRQRQLRQPESFPEDLSRAPTVSRPATPAEQVIAWPPRLYAEESAWSEWCWAGLRWHGPEPT